MKNIKSLTEIDYSASEIVSFNATVLEVLADGDGDKRPMKFTLKLEDSGEQVTVSSWKFDYLETLKALISSDAVYEFSGQAGTYGNYGNQIRIGGMKDAGLKSSRKIIKAINSSELLGEVNAIVETYLPKSSIYRRLVEDLVLTNQKFWIWPAASKVHHAYEGGLAKHSLNVCRNAISVWKTYQGSNLDITLLVAGALLHDIGKIEEYNQDGSFTVYGSLLGHPVIGYEKIVRKAIEYGIDPESNNALVMLEHVILAHHGKLEFGAPITPGVLEASVVSQCDALDASFESGDKALDNMLLNERSNKLLGMDGCALFKWHN